MSEEFCRDNLIICSSLLRNFLKSVHKDGDHTQDHESMTVIETFFLSLAGLTFHKVFWGSPIDPWQQKKHGSMGFHRSVATKETWINGLPQKTVWRAFPFKTLRSSVAKIKRNLKMTVFKKTGIESNALTQMLQYCTPRIYFLCLIGKML